jgi:hypothetical protein
MRITCSVLACVLAAGVAAAGRARADDGVRAELEALKRRIAEQDRKLRELEARDAASRTSTDDEISSSVDRYLRTLPAADLVGGADGGKAGFPLGKKPFIQEGPNKVNFIFRNQVRYSGFLYSDDDAVGTLASPVDTLSGAAPRDRSGFEIERLYLGIEGTIFCENISYQAIINYDADTGGTVEKEFLWLDWKYTGEHHLRAGTDKVPFTYEEQNSTGSLAFADRGIVAKAFAPGSDTGVALWGYFGDPCDCPKRFLYKVAATTGEGAVESAGSVFNTDAFDTYSDQLLFSGYLEWNITCKDWGFDEVDHRACEDRCRLDASLGICGMYENDDDTSHKNVGLALRSSGRFDRSGYGAWFRARLEGWSLEAEYMVRSIDYQGSAAPTQTDAGLQVTLHHRFAESNWGLGAKAGIIWLDDDYSFVAVGQNPPVAIEDTITEFGFVVNYFFWDHANKLTGDVTWVQDNSAVSASSSGYLVDPKKGVVIEDGIMFRLQWQLQF